MERRAAVMGRAERAVARSLGEAHGVAVEDHPLEYGTFEGTIPEGEYGGGTVMVWDRGAWIPEVDDVDEALERGELKFSLKGQKLKGSWVLVRLKPRGNSSRTTWLLIKHRDRYASDSEVTTAKPRSVASKRLMKEIAGANGGNIEKAAAADPH